MKDGVYVNLIINSVPLGVYVEDVNLKKSFKEVLKTIQCCNDT